jgi:methionyl-tRNA formyltransferase
VRLAADEAGIPVAQPPRVRTPEFVAQIEQLRPDALVVAAFGQIIPQAMLDAPRLGPVNVHASVLPRWRGAAPIHRAILEGDAATGVTTMFMDATLDTGDILLSSETPILPNDDTGTLTSRLAEMGADLLLQTLEGLASGSVTRIPQDGSRTTYAAPVTPDDARIRWDEPAGRCLRRMQAMAPRPGAVTMLCGKRVKIWAAQRVEGHAEPGLIVAQGNAGVTVGAGDACVLVTEAQPEGCKRMPASAWACGCRIIPGETRFDR